MPHASSVISVKSRGPRRRYFLSALLGISLAAISACQPFFGATGKHEEIVQVKNPCIVLALPASGPYASVASRIKQGAEAARTSLKKNGIDAQIRNINTEEPDWLAKLAALPPMCQVVGGPLRDKKYLQARKAGALENRVFFSFLPSLAQGDEGRRAWRFFPSPQDQIDALVNFTTDRMGIRTYGAFYPADNYGRRMTELLEKKLAKRHIPLQKAMYSPGSTATWSGAMKTLVNPRMAQDGKTIVPGTTFEALFTPDSWKRMDSIAQSLRENGEDRVALLGTTVWEQGLTGKQPVMAGRYELAFFPVAWNRANAPAAMRKSGYNFWNALGYDFVNFASYMGLAKKPQAAAVTNLAQKISPMLKVMAPLTWDSNGIGHQRMYLYQPGPQGMTPLNARNFGAARTAAAEKAALRMQGWSHIDPDTGEALAGRNGEQPLGRTVNPAAQDENVPEIKPAIAAENPSAQQFVHTVSNPYPAQEASGPFPAREASAPRPQGIQPAGQAAQGVMSSTPRPSYKLSLPVRQ